MAKAFIPIIGILCIFSSISIEAQNSRFSDYLYENIPEKDLPFGRVNDMIEDEQGFLWFGTKEGLYKYDGYTYENIEIKPFKDTPGTIISLFQDSNGLIWIAYNEHLLTYNPQKETWKIKNGAPKYIGKIYEDNFKNIWVCTALESKVSLLSFPYNLYPDSTFNIPIKIPVDYDFISETLRKSKELKLSSIEKVPNNSSISQNFELPSRKKLLIIGMGEKEDKPNGEFSDNGWIENSMHQSVWRMDIEKGLPDQGAKRNFIFIDTVYLEKGNYSIHYETDGKNGYGSWVDGEPPNEDLWGIQLFDISGKQDNNIHTLIEEINSKWISFYSIETQFHSDIQGNLWIGCSGGILKIDNEEIRDRKLLKSSISNYTLIKRHESLKLMDYNILDISFKDENRLYIAGIKDGIDSESKVFMEIFDLEKGSFEVFNNKASTFINNLGLDASTNIINMIEDDSNGGIWLSLDGNNRGLFYLEKPFDKIPLKIDLPNNAKILTLLKSKTGIIWASTSSNNLLKIFPNRTKIKKFTLPEGKNANKSWLNSIVEDEDGIVWMGTNSNGLYKFNLSTYKFDNYETPNEIPFRGGMRDFIRIISDKQGRIWGSAKGGILLYNTDKIAFTKFNFDEQDKQLLEDKEFIPLSISPSGKIWGRCNNYILCFNPNTQKFEFDPKFPKITSSIKVIEDDKRNLWIAAGNLKGLQKISLDTSRNGRYIHESQFLYLPWDFIIDDSNNVWAAANAIGLIKLHPEKGITKTIKRKDGLIHNTIYKILKANNDHLWLFLANGLQIYNPSSDSLYTYNELSFLPGSKGTVRSNLLHSSGNMIITNPGESEFYLFDPEKIERNKFSPQIRLKKLFISNEEISLSENSILNKSFGYTDQLFLDHTQSNIVVEYVGIHFDKPELIQYEFKLEGFDKHWNFAGNERVARYSNLPPGSYTLKIRASNGDGVWNEQGASLVININPPWYWNNFSKALYLIISIALLYLIYLWRTREQREKIILQERDLDREKQINAQLKQVDQLKDQFLANTSHELRTPLHGMVGLAEAMFEKADAGDKENLGMLVASGKRLSSLVNDLLDFSKVKNHDLQLSPKALGLRPIVDLVLQSCRPLLGSKAVELLNEIPADLPPIYADENRLQQILYNLLGNAIKFTESGQIKVGVLVGENESDELLTVFVQDTGIGIAKEKQAAIFQAFEQADGSTAREYGGTGLGLSISKQLVELHGGEIWLESEAGKGATFFFSLPKADAANISRISATPSKTAIESSLFRPANSTETQADPQTTPIGVKGDRIRILLVDDEPINHQVIKNYFDGGEIYLRSVMSGHEALEVIQKEPQFDLILLDIMMPRMNGYEVCKEIRKQYLASEMPVIMLTAKNQISDLVQGLETGANDYIAKPFSKDEFLARIKTHVNLHKIHSATHKFVPRDFLKSIDRDNITEVRLGDQKEQNVTVFFSDIRSYTSLSESMTPEENFKFVNAYAGRMGPIIRENGGFVNQYLGDGIMGIFQKKPEDALQAAIGMQREISKYNLQREEQGRRQIEVGMGMHAGSLIMGVIGDEERNDSATISDTVNTASRMEGLTKHFGARIILSETVYQALENKEAYTLRYLGLVQVKGKDQPIGIYECLDALPQAKLEKMKASLPVFEDGLQQYFSKNFEKAAVAFREALSHVPEDKTTQLYLARCASYMVVGVPQEWVGVELMEKK